MAPEYSGPTPSPGTTAPDRPSKVKVYSPRQVFLGTFLCGPLAGLWFIKCNFEALGRADLAARTIHWGSAISALILTLMPVLPTTFPPVLVPLVYSVLALFVAENYQVKSTALIDSDRYAAQSNWAVVRHGAIAFALLLAIAFAFIFCLTALGLIDLSSPLPTQGGGAV
jgi:hypothetical protein